MPEYIYIDEKLKNKSELWISRVLRVGIWISAFLMIAGLLISAIYSNTISLTASLSFKEIKSLLTSGSFEPAALLYTGILVLMFTPIIRVVTAIFRFALEKDWNFVIVSSAVFLILLGEIVYSSYIK